MNEATTATRDDQDLARQGYRQELHRALGSFSAFAAGFSYLSILTGVFQNFHLGYRNGGPAFFWTWPILLGGQFCVALCFAELSAHYPLCGGVYQWAKRVGSRGVGWFAGWVYLASLIVTLAAVALALQTTLPQVLRQAQLVGDPAGKRKAVEAEDTSTEQKEAAEASANADEARNAVVLGLLLIAFSMVINSVGVAVLARINNAGVFTELIGSLVLIVLLAWFAVRGPGVVLDSQGHGEGLGYLPAFLASGIVAAYVLYGFDTAGNLAEETAEPRRRAPWAILQALAAAGVMGGLLLLFALMAAPAPEAKELSSESDGLPWLVKTVLGERLGVVFLVDVVFAITVCTLAVHTGAARMLFAMARDDGLPGSAALARVAPNARVPLRATLLTGAAALVLLGVNAFNQEVVTAIVAVSIVWANVAYLLVMVPLLVARLRGWPRQGGSGVAGVFALGRWGLPLNVLAVLTGLATAVNIGWPREAVYGKEWYALYAAPLFTGLLLFVGIVYYWGWQRHKAGVLKGHEATMGSKS
jgi:urea carboxylase system permease